MKLTKETLKQLIKEELEQQWKKAIIFLVSREKSEGLFLDEGTLR